MYLHTLNLVITVDLILQLRTSVARKKSHFVGDWEGARAGVDDVDNTKISSLTGHQTRITLNPYLNHSFV
jgi:hypothetical protein